MFLFFFLISLFLISCRLFLLSVSPSLRCSVSAAQSTTLRLFYLIPYTLYPILILISCFVFLASFSPLLSCSVPAFFFLDSFFFVFFFLSLVSCFSSTCTTGSASPVQFHATEWNYGVSAPSDSHPENREAGWESPDAEAH